MGVPFIQSTKSIFDTGLATRAGVTSGIAGNTAAALKSATPVITVAPNTTPNTTSTSPKKPPTRQIIPVRDLLSPSSYLLNTNRVVGTDPFGNPVTEKEVIANEKNAPNQGVRTIKGLHDWSLQHMTVESGVHNQNVETLDYTKNFGVKPNDPDYKEAIIKADDTKGKIKSEYEAETNFEKNYPMYKKTYEDNLSTMQSSAPESKFWLDVNQNKQVEIYKGNKEAIDYFSKQGLAVNPIESTSDELFGRDVAIEKYNESWKPVAESHKNITEGNTINKLRSQAIDIINFENTLNAYEQAGYTLDVSDSGYSFGTMKASEVNKKVYGDVVAESRVVALLIPETSLTLGFNFLVRGVESLLGGKNPEEQYEELSARSLDLTMRPNEKGTNVLSYTGRFWTSGEAILDVWLPVATFGVSSVVTALTTTSVRTGSSALVRGLSNWGSKALFTGGKISRGIEVANIAKGVGYTLLGTAIVSTGVSIGATAATNPKETGSVIRQNLVGWMGAIEGGYLGSKYVANQAGKPIFNEEGLRQTNVRGVVKPGIIEQVGDNLYSLDLTFSQTVKDVGTGKVQTYKGNVKGLGSFIDEGKTLSVQKGIGILETPEKGLFTKSGKAEIFNVTGLSLKLGESGKWMLDWSASHATFRNPKLGSSTETGFGIYKRAEPTILESGKELENIFNIKRGNMVQKGGSKLFPTEKWIDITEEVGVDISAGSHLGLFKTKTTAGTYQEGAEILNVKGKSGKSAFGLKIDNEELNLKDIEQDLTFKQANKKTTRVELKTTPRVGAISGLASELAVESFEMDLGQEILLFKPQQASSELRVSQETFLLPSSELNMKSILLTEFSMETGQLLNMRNEQVYSLKQEQMQEQELMTEQIFDTTLATEPMTETLFETGTMIPFMFPKHGISLKGFDEGSWDDMLVFGRTKKYKTGNIEKAFKNFNRAFK